MPTIRVRFEKGVFVPEQPVDIPDGQTGTVIVHQNTARSSPDAMEPAWRELLELIDQSSMETGIADMAEQHDHYLYGTEKQTTLSCYERATALMAATMASREYPRCGK